MSEQIRIVLCRTKASLARPAENAWIDWCHRCKAEIWVAPTTRAFMEQQTVLLVCMECGEKIHEGDEESEWRVMPGQRDEILREVLRRRAEDDKPPVTGL